MSRLLCDVVLKKKSVESDNIISMIPIIKQSWWDGFCDKKFDQKTEWQENMVIAWAKDLIKMIPDPVDTMGTNPDPSLYVVLRGELNLEKFNKEMDGMHTWIPEHGIQETIEKSEERWLQAIKNVQNAVNETFARKEKEHEIRSC